MKRILILLSILVLAGIAGIYWWKAGEVAEFQAATVFGEQARPLPAFSLTRHDGEALEPEDFRGHWSLLFFGYSNCPDICSPSMQQLTTALQTLGEEQARIVFVSVDSERDSPEALSRYVGYFHSGTLGLPVRLKRLRTLQNNLVPFIPNDHSPPAISSTTAAAPG